MALRQRTADQPTMLPPEDLAPLAALAHEEARGDG